MVPNVIFWLFCFFTVLQYCLFRILLHANQKLNVIRCMVFYYTIVSLFFDETDLVVMSDDPVSLGFFCLGGFRQFFLFYFLFMDLNDSLKI